MESHCLPRTWPILVSIENFIVRQWIYVTAFKAFSNGMPSTPLKADGHFIERKSITTVAAQGGSPRVTTSLMVPLGITLSSMNP